MHSPSVSSGLLRLLGEARLSSCAMTVSTRGTWLVVCGGHGLAEAQCTLQWVHVDSHTGDELNDRADGLAALGGNGLTKALDDLPSETGGALRDLPGDLGGA